MSHEENKEAVSLSADQQRTFDADVANLQKVGEEAGVAHLEGRVKFGLDPAAMMLMPETAPLTAEMSEKLGVDQETVLNLIKELHKRGPWDFAERLKDGSEPEIKAYIAMASMCHEKGWPGYKPNEYLEDRARVISDLAAFDPAKLDKYRKDMADRIKGFEDKTEVIDGKEIKIAAVDSDAALSLAMDGYKGCVVRGGEMRFVQTTNIPDAILESSGLVKGFGEVYDPAIDNFKRVSADTEGARIIWVDGSDASKPIDEMTPRVKRIAPGFVLAYKDEALAMDIVKKAVAES
jgi:hypothetical protein